MLNHLTLSLLTLNYATQVLSQFSEEGVKYANRCETCKIMTREMQEALEETGKNKEKIEVGRFTINEKKTKKIIYQKSELRFIEVYEQTCKKINDYQMHKERKGSLRFEKGMSETFKTLHALKDRGVKVDLGMPEDMWDETPAEVTNMVKLCDQVLGEDFYEEAIQEWYYDDNNFGRTLQDYFCRDVFLTKDGDDTSCLDEVWTGKEKVNADESSLTEEEIQRQAQEQAEAEKDEL